ncbi:MAG: hypothetical protein HQM16_15920 [Deltaproteobacteria bacterium]|nr:hypothetical protein [Deltaproteobacteria bacterium]
MTNNHQPDPSSPKQKIKRRQILVYPRFQLRLLATNIVIMLGMIIFVTFQTASSFENMLDVGHAKNFTPDHIYFNLLKSHADLLYSYLSIALVGGFVLSCLVTLIISHKMAGPLVRLRQYFEGISETGEAGAIKFRKNDYCQELVEPINRAIEKLKKQ